MARTLESRGPSEQQLQVVTMPLTGCGREKQTEGVERTRQRTQSLPPREARNWRATASEKDVAR